MNPKRHAPFLTVLAALYIVSCAAPADDPTQKAWSVVYTQSGGIAGIHRRISLDHTGKLLMADPRTGKKKAKQISGDELREFAGSLSQLETLNTAADEASSPQKMAPSRCRDCINHTLIIHFDKRTYRHHWQFTDKGAGRFAELVQRLSEMAES